MKSPFENFWLLLLALALLLAMALTLWLGGEKSRHGYGWLLISDPPAHGRPVSTGYPRDCQAQMPPYML